MWVWRWIGSGGDSGSRSGGGDGRCGVEMGDVEVGGGA